MSLSLLVVLSCLARAVLSGTRKLRTGWRPAEPVGCALGVPARTGSQGRLDGGGTLRPQNVDEYSRAAPGLPNRTLDRRPLSSYRSGGWSTNRPVIHLGVGEHEVLWVAGRQPRAGGDHGGGNQAVRLGQRDTSTRGSTAPAPSQPIRTVESRTSTGELAHSTLVDLALSPDPTPGVSIPIVTSVGDRTSRRPYKVGAFVLRKRRLNRVANEAAPAPLTGDRVDPSHQRRVHVYVHTHVLRLVPTRWDGR